LFMLSVQIQIEMVTSLIGLILFWLNTLLFQNKIFIFFAEAQKTKIWAGEQVLTLQS
jgi:hypothetical protein